MRVPPGCRSLVLAALVMVVFGDLAPDAEAKGKKAACKGTKVAVTVGKKKTCQPFAKAFPKPQAVDLRLAYLQQALKLDPSKLVKGKKHKRARSLQSGFGAAGKRAQKKILGLLPKALAFFDRKRAGASASAFGPGPALTSANCGVGRAGDRGTIGGSTSIGMLGENGIFIETDAGGGFRIRLTFFSCGGVDSFRIPECPTGPGDIESATANGDFSATTEIFRGNRLESRQTTTFEDTSKARGKVGKDAKLKYVDVEHRQVMLIVASGGLVIRGVVQRKIRIDMPAGNLDPDAATVLYSGDWISSDFGAKGFARSAKAAIDSMKAVEKQFSEFDGSYCAHAAFSPESNALKLKPGDSKQASVYAKASDGSRATEAKWDFLNQINADFTPGSTESAAPTISYTVKSATPDYIEMTAKFTSTAGVGEDKWRQPVEAREIKFIEGSFGGEMYFKTAPPLDAPIRHQWNGSVKLQRFGPPIGGAAGIYQVISGSVSIQSSGIEPTGATGCHGSGQAQAQITEGSVFVLPKGAEGLEGGPPYTYSFGLTLPLTKYIITRFACPEAAQKEGYESPPKSEIEWGATWSMNTENQESVDGLTFNGTEKQDLGGGSYFEETWALHGTE